MLSCSEASAETSTLSSTIDAINAYSNAYLNGVHNQYTLKTEQGSETDSLLINGIRYYYTPNEASQELNSTLKNLTLTGGAALKLSDVNDYVFYDGEELLYL